MYLKALASLSQDTTDSNPLLTLADSAITSMLPLKEMLIPSNVKHAYSDLPRLLFLQVAQDSKERHKTLQASHEAHGKVLGAVLRFCAGRKTVPYSLPIECF